MKTDRQTGEYRCCTFIRTDSESFSLLTIFMATFCPVIQWTPSFTSPERHTERETERERERGGRKCLSIRNHHAVWKQEGGDVINYSKKLYWHCPKHWPNSTHKRTELNRHVEALCDFSPPPFRYYRNAHPVMYFRRCLNVVVAE